MVIQTQVVNFYNKHTSIYEVDVEWILPQDGSGAPPLSCSGLQLSCGGTAGGFLRLRLVKSLLRGRPRDLSSAHLPWGFLWLLPPLCPSKFFTKWSLNPVSLLSPWRGGGVGEGRSCHLPCPPPVGLSVATQLLSAPHHPLARPQKGHGV